MSLVTINNEYLSAIGTSIRNKNGTTDLIKPKDMAAAIDAITTGGGGDVEIPTITGDCKYRFSSDGWNWVIEQFGSQLKTADITGCMDMFGYCYTLTNIPFEINCKDGSTPNMDRMFQYCNVLTSIPKFNNAKPSGMNNLFESCTYLRNLPEDIEDWFDWSYIDGYTSSYRAGRGGMFKHCYSLRSIPMGFLNHENPNAANSYTIYQNTFQYCYSLDEIVGLPIPTTNKAKTSNMFSSTFSNCTRLKNMTFKTNEDGSPIVVQWSNQTIDLSYNVGWGDSTHYILNYNSGITSDKEMTPTNISQLYDDPDYYTQYPGCSRYHLYSARRTINSLPDTSAYLATAGGTNTIKFKADAGNALGNNISDLTDEDIAVAAAKGWTVSLIA